MAINAKSHRIQHEEVIRGAKWVNDVLDGNQGEDATVELLLLQERIETPHVGLFQDFVAIEGSDAILKVLMNFASLGLHTTLNQANALRGAENLNVEMQVLADAMAMGAATDLQTLLTALEKNDRNLSDLSSQIGTLAESSMSEKPDQIIGYEMTAQNWMAIITAARIGTQLALCVHAKGESNAESG